MVSPRLQAFLYLLMRDSVVPGEVERLVREAEKNTDMVYSNTYLAGYAEHLGRRLSQLGSGNPKPPVYDDFGGAAERRYKGDKRQPPQEAVVHHPDCRGHLGPHPEVCLDRAGEVLGDH